MKLEIKVTPNARKNQIAGWVGDKLKIKISKPPEKGKANKELIKYLSEEWKLPRNCISIKQGFKSREKTIEIASNKPIHLPAKPQRLI